MTQAFYLPKARPLTSGGKVTPGAKLTFYLVGTTTLADVYTDSAGTIAHTNPVIADSNGEFAPIYLTAARDVKLTDSADAAIWGPSTVTYSNPLVYATTADETTAGVTVVDSSYPPGNVLRYGATEGGVTNCSTAFAAAASLITYGIDTVIPAGQWMLTSQVTWTLTGLYNRPKISGYGAEIFTTNAISAIKVTGRSTPNGLTIEGLKINHRGNATATAGIEATATDHLRIVDCVVEAHGVSASYKGIWLHNGTAADADTGCFWTEIENFVCRKRSGADSGDITHGIMLQGAANATNILGGSLKTCTAGITITVESGQTYMPNAVLIDGTRFEGDTTGIAVIGAVTGPCSGLRIVNHRAETLTTFLSLTVATTQPAVPTYVGSGYYAIDVTTIVNNPNSLYISRVESSFTPDVAPSLWAGSATTIRAGSGSEHALKVTPGGGSRGIQLNDNAGASAGSWQWVSGTATLLTGTAANLSLQQVGSVYFGSTAAVSITTGAGTPESVVTAPIGSIFLRNDGGASTTLYVKTSGSGTTGWTAK